MIPLSGFLARLLSTRALFVLSAAGFTLASLACAAADSLEAMILARTVQGFAGGAMIPTVFATAYLIFPRERQATMSLIVGLVATAAPAVGPTLGGWLTTAFSWHWLFLVNLVPGAAVVVGAWTLLDVDRPDRSLLAGFDLPGLLAMATFLGGLQYVLDEGPDRDWLDDGTVRLVATAATAGAAVFVWRVLTHFSPIVDLRCLADRNFALGSLLSFLLGLGLYGSVFLLPLFLGRVRGYSALDIGWVMAVTGCAQLAAAPVASRLAARLDHRVMLTFGMALFAIGAWLNGFLTSQSGFGELALPQAVRGAAMLFCFIRINRLALGTLPPAELKNASGVFNLTRNLGGAVGLALLNTLLHHREALHWSRLADHVDPARPEVEASLDLLADRLEPLLPGVDARLAALDHLGGLVHREALVQAFNDAFLAVALLFAAALCLMPLIRRPAPGVVAGTG